MNKRSLDRMQGENRDSPQVAGKVFKSEGQVSANISQAGDIYYRRRRIVCTVDASEAERYQFLTEITCRDKITLYTSWSIFVGIEYFENIMSSHMKETLSRQITFEYLDHKQAEAYLELLSSSRNSKDFTWGTRIFSLFEQANYHQIREISSVCTQRILELPYSAQLYAWNKLHNIISHKDMAAKYYEVKDNHLYFPVDDEEFLIAYLVYCSSHTPRNIFADWCVIREMPYELVVKCIKYCTSCGFYDSVPILVILEMKLPTEQLMHRELFVKHIVKLRATLDRNMYISEMARNHK